MPQVDMRRLLTDQWESSVVNTSKTQNLFADPFAGKLTPPDGLLPRFKFYRRRSGFLYAALSYGGRRSFTFWRLVAPFFTRPKIRKWRQRPGPHIVNLGGGSNLFDRWLTADVDPRADVFVDVTRPLPFEDNALDAIYLEELIEHISHEQAVSLLTECFRILTTGGGLRLTTPDLDAFASAFDKSTSFEQKFNDIFYKHGHRYIFSRSGVRDLLAGTGFCSIRQSSFRDEDSRFGYFDTHALRFAVSDASLTQYWEAQKGAE